ncbi:hypothetical protein [Rhizobium sp. SL42]|uniref:hypothetical protein n=1 Tax=Rhizobium sp. SL42 TaxID=2806346 RepID=UPI001F414309|nr:hypothetical protein [Rhizobium sp. SL42]UJW73545.1 hypothetical protein IM739_11545 [Rhizobium sp. SL42]
MAQVVSGLLPTTKSTLFRLGFISARTVFAIVVGGHPCRMVCPRHLSSDQPGDVDDDPLEVFTCGAARFFGTTVRAAAGRALSFAAPCPLSSPSMFDLPFPDGKTM